MELINKKTGQPENVPEEQVGNKFLSGQYGFKKSDPVFLMDPDGRVGKYIPEDVHMAVTKGGFSFPTQKDIHDFQMREKYGDRPYSSFALGAADSATFGGSSHLLEKSGMVSQEALKEIPERNPISNTAGQVTGVAASLALSPEAALVKGAREALRAAKMSGNAVQIAKAKDAYLSAKKTLTAWDAINPVSAVNKIGMAAADAAAYAPEAATAAGKILNAGAREGIRSAVEGAAYELGQINRDAAIGEIEVSPGQIVSQVGFTSLLSGAFGAALGSTIKGAGVGAKTFSEAIEKSIDKKVSDGALNDLVEGTLSLASDTLVPAGFKRIGKRVMGVADHVDGASVVREKLANIVDKAIKQIVSKARTALEVGEEGVKRSIGPVTAEVTDNFQIKENRAKQRKEFDRVTKEIGLMVNNPEILFNTLDRSTKDLFEYAPKTARGIQDTIIKGVSFLNSKIPQKTTSAMIPEAYVPSDAELSKFFKYYSYVQNPLKVLDTLKNNTVSIEGVETLKTVYQDLYNTMRTEIVWQLASEKRKPTYQKRLALSLFLGQDVDSSTAPQMIAANQASLTMTKNGMSNEADGNVKAASKNLGSMNLAGRSTTPLDQAAQRSEDRQT